MIELDMLQTRLLAWRHSCQVFRWGYVNTKKVLYCLNHFFYYDRTGYVTNSPIRLITQLSSVEQSRQSLSHGLWSRSRLDPPPPPTEKSPFTGEILNSLVLLVCVRWLVEWWVISKIQRDSTLKQPSLESYSFRLQNLQLMENVKPSVDRFEVSDRSVILYVKEVICKTMSLARLCEVLITLAPGIPDSNMASILKSLLFVLRNDSLSRPG